jgi:hypothetical protein
MKIGALVFTVVVIVVGWRNTSGSPVIESSLFDAPDNNGVRETHITRDGRSF